MCRWERGTGGRACVRVRACMCGRVRARTRAGARARVCVARARMCVRHLEGKDHDPTRMVRVVRIAERRHEPRSSEIPAARSMPTAHADRACQRSTPAHAAGARRRSRAHPSPTVLSFVIRSAIAAVHIINAHTGAHACTHAHSRACTHIRAHRCPSRRTRRRGTPGSESVTPAACVCNYARVRARVCVHVLASACARLSVRGRACVCSCARRACVVSVRVMFGVCACACARAFCGCLVWLLFLLCFISYLRAHGRKPDDVAKDHRHVFVPPRQDACGCSLILSR